MYRRSRVSQVVRSHLNELPVGTHNAVLCCGYPLNNPEKPEGADPKRPAHLLNLPAGTRVRLLQARRQYFPQRAHDA